MINKSEKLKRAKAIQKILNNAIHFVKAINKMLWEDIHSPTPKSNRSKPIENITKNGFLLSISGKKIHLQADTFCIHGDSPNIVDYLSELNVLCDEKI